MNWIFISLNWYFYILILGLLFTPLTKKIFKHFSLDFGYPFTKVLAIIFISYTAYILGILKILSFNQKNLFLIISIFALINFLIFFRNKKLSINNSRFLILLFEEFLFFVSFLFWTFIRSQEPSIRSLEKFMDFGFINSILRSDFFPPKDIWYTPEPINYYYFGHLTGALLIKLTGSLPSIGYNLILATIFALGITEVFSLVINIINIYKQKTKKIIIVLYGLIAALLVNLGGNLHTIYLFTKGYPNENPIPFWKILSSYNPISYWYPNATRFIPFTIHEFPSYSYVVADLHGHVFDIPFVLLTIAILFLLFINTNKEKNNHKKNFKFLISKIFTNQYSLNIIFLGFLTAIHYMTNAFDGPIYILLSIFVFVFLFGFSSKFFLSFFTLVFSFLIFNLPFSSYFKPFVTGIGVNCSPDFLTNIRKIGPFLFEEGNCQVSPLWMLFILWGFFWISFIMFLIVNKSKKLTTSYQSLITKFIIILFSFSTFLIIVPEFFYIKDIYPAHFRANTMFKLGYQAFIMMGIASIITLFYIKQKKTIINFVLTIIYFLLLFFIIIYPFYSIPSYYGSLNRKSNLDGSIWLKIEHPEDKEIIDYLNKNIKDQPVILEAQGDSYTDYERISAYTGLPTVAGWWVHEWLWRGSSDIVGNRIPEIVTLYESKDVYKTKQLIEKYKIKYVIISKMEKEKYPNLYQDKFSKIGKLIFRSTNNLGAIYQIK